MPLNKIRVIVINAGEYGKVGYRTGSNCSMADEPFATYVVRDGRLITGQNPGSARAVAEAVADELKG